MSEPQHISSILPGVMKRIDDQCNRYRARHGLPNKHEAETSIETPRIPPKLLLAVKGTQQP